jgi:hypothetical protein
VNDWDIMQKCRIKWERERAAPLDPDMGEAYHRGFMDALEVALNRVIAEDRTKGEMSEPIWCVVRQHYCRCGDYGKRCDDFDDDDRYCACGRRIETDEEYRDGVCSECK